MALVRGHTLTTKDTSSLFINQQLQLISGLMMGLVLYSLVKSNYQQVQGTVALGRSGRSFQTPHYGRRKGQYFASMARYSVRQGGIQIATTPSTQGSRLYRSYQGLWWNIRNHRPW